MKLTARSFGLLLCGLFILSHISCPALAETTFHEKCRALPHTLQGPFISLPDGSILSVGKTEAIRSSDGGKTWQASPLFKDPSKFETRPERALIRTKDGTIVFAFLNQKEYHPGKWDNWSPKALREYYLPTYVMRSTDDGKTWEEPKKIQDGWCGAIRSLIQLENGRLVLVGQDIEVDPGRHITWTYVSDDDGETWSHGNKIDLGGIGDHGGTMEATVVELKDGRVMMLIRTVLGRFWKAYSNDGQFWRVIHPSRLTAVSAPAQLARLKSGRLVVVWNDLPKEIPMQRGELSIAYSEDEGRTWSPPVIIASDPKMRIAYPYIYEPKPGEIWITTTFETVAFCLKESDLIEMKPKTAGPDVDLSAVSLPKVDATAGFEGGDPVEAKPVWTKHGTGGEIRDDGVLALKPTGGYFIDDRPEIFDGNKDTLVEFRAAVESNRDPWDTGGADAEVWISGSAPQSGCGLYLKDDAVAFNPHFYPKYELDTTKFHTYKVLTDQKKKLAYLFVDEGPHPVLATKLSTVRGYSINRVLFGDCSIGNRDVHGSSIWKWFKWAEVGKK